MCFDRPVGHHHVDIQNIFKEVYIYYIKEKSLFLQIMSTSPVFCKKDWTCNIICKKWVFCAKHWTP